MVLCSFAFGLFLSLDFFFSPGEYLEYMVPLLEGLPKPTETPHQRSWVMPQASPLTQALSWCSIAELEPSGSS